MDKVRNTDHVHLNLVPETATALTVCQRETHRRYTRHVNLRERWRSYLWQGWFASCVLDQAHLRATARYAEGSPVRAGLRAAPGGWPWSSDGAADETGVSEIAKCGDFEVASRQFSS